MPEIAKVKLDVYDNKRNSLISIANAINAPNVIFMAKKTPSGDTEESDVSESFSKASPRFKHLIVLNIFQ